MSSQSNESSQRGEGSQNQRLLEVDENSNVDMKPASKPKRGIWRKALGLGNKAEMNEEKMKKITKEINKIQEDIRKTEDNHENNQKRKRTYREQFLREYLGERQETTEEEEERKLKHPGTDAHPNVSAMKRRWQEYDRIARAGADDLLGTLRRSEQNLYSQLEELERQHEKLKGKDKISTRERERLQLQELKEKDDISIEEAKNRLRQSTPSVVSEKPSYFKERKPSSSPEELKMEMMLEWEDETCKEWIYDHLEDYLETYEMKHVKDDLAQMQEICGQRMFKATEGEWQDWLYDAGRVMHCKLQSIVKPAMEKRTVEERNCGSGSDHILVL
ncbi:predicted protein [Sclerotinia sclerotiorum 1980 UF-70]|uniref:Uncharacterized protein n=2 Tax=Sclerotinia sclerotiorum (strain ATCC 18683 / 1980 / Ss-1) TaxID=665079 RepID=A7E5F6_SCLS1|nr:predicted protein [Sclerotinia sclerotiorum 1980 UF-70]APA07863.1 hypothetical protein sscle_03g026330 [Sclerotinia sclerotiorum 1980 UF-70]EDN91128.1 predicted protein [Sclerotinia sclerotiorum 1980 UF-70]